VTSNQTAVPGGSIASMSPLLKPTVDVERQSCWSINDHGARTKGIRAP